MTEQATHGYTVPQPSDAIKQLDRLIGTWVVSGGTNGTVRYEWMDGGFFLLQHVDLQSNGQAIKGLELIGQLRPFGESPSEHIHSRYYGNTGDTLDYVYEVEGDTLTIWGGVKGSPAYYKGTFSQDGNTLSGAWVYPDGGYDSVSKRLKS